MNRRVIYGSDDFLREMTNAYQFEAVIRAKGRPGKEDDDNGFRPACFLTGSGDVRKNTLPWPGRSCPQGGD